MRWLPRAKNTTIASEPVAASMEVDQGPNKGNKIQFVVLPDGVHLEFTTRINE